MRSIDPTEWANRKKAAMERAKQIREERKNSVNDNDTFQPQLVSRRGSNASNVGSNSNLRGDSLDRLTTEVRANDPMDLPLPALQNKQRGGAAGGGGSYYDEDNNNQNHPSLPSPGSDALGKELKRHNSKNLNNPFDDQPVGRAAAAGGGGPVPAGGNNRVQYQSKFLRQYDDDNDGVLSGNNNVRNNNNSQQRPPPQQPAQSQRSEQNPDEDFLNLLRSDGSKGRSSGPGWNDDTTANGFGPLPNGKKALMRKEKASNETSIKTTSTPKGTRSNAANADDYYGNRQRSVSQPSGDDYGSGGGYGHSKLSPQTAPTTLYLNGDNSNQPVGNAARPSPRDPIVHQARSSLSLLKSKIKQTESFNGTRSLKKSFNDATNNDDNNNDYDNSSVNSGGQYSSHSNGKSSNGNNNGKIVSNNSSNSRFQNNHYEDDYNPLPTNKSNGIANRGNVGYEPSIPQQRNTNGRVPVPTNTRNNAPVNNNSKANQFRQEDSDEEENVMVMVPKNRSAANLNNHREQPAEPRYNRNPPPQQQQQPQRGSAPKPITPRQPAYEEDEYNQNSYNRTAPKQSFGAANPYSSPDYGNDENDYPDETNLPQQECPDCGRKFIPSAFQKHVKICAKVFLQKRKKFDSTKQRLQGEGVDPELKKVYEKKKKEEMRAKKMGGGAAAAPEPVRHEEQPVGGGGEGKWKQQSQAFRAAMKAARDYAKAKERGESPPPPAISAPDPSLIPCPHCGRRFSEMAGSRHIPQCKNIKAKPNTLKKGSGTGAAVAVKARR